MISLYNGNITDILPEALSKKPEVQALGYALSRATQRLIGYCQNISVYAAIDTLPEQALDLLAVELNTQYYDTSLKIDIKRTLIKNTLNWYMHTGTAAAVMELVESVFGNGEVEEWFDYGGEPYHFRIRTANINSTDEMVQQIMNLVGTMKNVRSHLDEIIVEVVQQLQIYFGCVVESVSDITTIGIDMNLDTDISTVTNRTLLLTDSSTGTIYSVSVVNGYLTMSEQVDASGKAIETIWLTDSSTGTIHQVSVIEGKLTMSEAINDSDSAIKTILLADAITGTVYVISVVDGKLTMN